MRRLTYEERKRGIPLLGMTALIVTLKRDETLRVVPYFYTSEAIEVWFETHKEIPFYVKRHSRGPNHLSSEYVAIVGENPPLNTEGSNLWRLDRFLFVGNIGIDPVQLELF